MYANFRQYKFYNLQKLQLVLLSDAVVDTKIKLRSAGVLLTEYEEKIAQLEFENKKVVEVTLTAYNAVRTQTDSDPTKTALMRKPIPGKSVAVSRDLQHLLGSEIYIPQLGVRIVNDLMAPSHSKKMDILVPTEQMAKNFGKQENVRVVILPKGKS